ncbi:MAG: DNA-binding protein [Erysipelotrichaceae bacterium]|nr:DNA-binding protein [Erysipelotrichaceae bacterium]
MLPDREKNILLLDYYGALLTQHQRNILDEYYNEDLSMNEIADNFMISKSAVQDLIKRSLVQMNDYEKRLKLIEKDKKLNKILEDMKNENNELIDSYIKKIEKVI